ncbi:Protein Wnt-2 [Hypsibius exemplaris]|uniref:Protein Wnt n=1 Tax=Hypsibius exemplaris TaxID=2072580 RepID=A0A9X6NEM0_HYPEX|nr:Protein Wnt-2 [Hypsibius exemplaris]
MRLFDSVAICLCIYLIPTWIGSTTAFWFLSDIPVGMLSGTGPLPCEHIPGLLKSQRHVCLEQPEVMVSIGEGVRTGIEECQNQFRNSRWNCTTIQQEDQAVGSREGAFVHAISSAGVVHSITRGCSSGDLTNCACDKKVTPAGVLQRDEKGNFSWTGCSDNVRYAVRFARKFVDVVEQQKLREEGEDLDSGGNNNAHHHTNDGGRALINLHNNRVGRKIVQESLVKQCKCHGVSGSCAARTCWMAIPSFRRTGDLLRKKFDVAEMVVMSSGSDGIHLRAMDRPRRKPLSTDLVYYEPSPDYCSTNYVTGSLGTGGRVCRLNSTGADSCEIMCCGRGYDTRRVERTRQCHCKFKWCCNVECEQCTETVDEQVSDINNLPQSEFPINVKHSHVVTCDNSFFNGSDNDCYLNTVVGPR